MTDTPVSCDRHLNYFHRGASACSRMSSDAAALAHASCSFVINRKCVVRDLHTNWWVDFEGTETTGNGLINLLYTVFFLTQVSTLKIVSHVVAWSQYERIFSSESLVYAVHGLQCRIDVRYGRRIGLPCGHIWMMRCNRTRCVNAGHLTDGTFSPATDCLGSYFTRIHCTWSRNIFPLKFPVKWCCAGSGSRGDVVGTVTTPRAGRPS